MGRRTLVVRPRGDGRVDCRIAHWGVDADPFEQSHPFGTGWPADAILIELDAAYEHLLVVDGTVETYCVCWLDPTLTDFEDVALALTDEPERLREQWVSARTLAIEALDRNETDPRTVRAASLLTLRRWADSVYIDDASFLRVDR